MGCCRAWAVLSPHQATDHGPHRCRCAGLAQGPRQGLPVTHQCHPASGDAGGTQGLRASRSAPATGAPPLAFSKLRRAARRYRDWIPRRARPSGRAFNCSASRKRWLMSLSLDAAQGQLFDPKTRALLVAEEQAEPRANAHPSASRCQGSFLGSNIATSRLGAVCCRPCLDAYRRRNQRATRSRAYTLLRASPYLQQVRRCALPRPAAELLCL
ncbi:hypothetical protein THIX_50029 [Thiomonas sp. X19]|nr:hypothetical protein THIX_50029 [Thiomonas sp. X19]